MKKIVIVGASSGIGYKLAEVFASRGVTVGLAARNTKPLEALQQLYPDCVKFARIDVNTKVATDHLKSLIDELGGMDIYIHVAGIGYDNPDLNPDREVQILETNVCGFARMISYVYTYFKTLGKPGQIAAITSVAGTKGTGCIAAYSASKKFDHAYLSALRQLANIEKVNVKITDIRPGWVETPLLKPGHNYPMLMNPNRVVVQILKALVKQKRVCVIDWRWRLMSALWAEIPNCLWEKIPMKSVDFSTQKVANK